MILIRRVTPVNIWTIKIRVGSGDGSAYKDVFWSTQDKSDFIEKARIILQRLELKRENWALWLRTNDRWLKEQKDWLEMPEPTKDGYAFTPSSVGLSYWDKHGVQYSVVLEDSDGCT